MIIYFHPLCSLTFQPHPCTWETSKMQASWAKALGVELGSRQALGTSAVKCKKYLIRDSHAAFSKSGAALRSLPFSQAARGTLLV